MGLVYNPVAAPLAPLHHRPKTSASPLSPLGGSSSPLNSVKQNRYAWTGTLEFLRHQTGAFYNRFFYSKSNVKYAMVFAFPMLLWSTRWRAEQNLGYYVYIEDEKLFPDYSFRRFLNRSWTNGTKMYHPDSLTVQELKEKIYLKRENIPEDIKVACHGRIFQDTDNLGNATRAFCKRDPKVLIFQDTLPAPLRPTV